MVYQVLRDQPSVRVIAHHGICDTRPGCWQELRARRSTRTAANNGQEKDDAQDNAETVRTRRKLGVCKGETHTLMLEEMLKGANVVISGDSGTYLYVCCLEKIITVLLNVQSPLRGRLFQENIVSVLSPAFFMPWCRIVRPHVLLEVLMPLARYPPGWFYEWFASMQDAYHRTCSHFSTRSTLGIPEGTVLRTVLTGEFSSILVPVLAQKYNAYCGIHDV